MDKAGTFIKKVSAAVLLALFAFILVEKSTHVHTGVNAFAKQDHSAVHHTYSCPICDFQLAADADLPVSTALVNTSSFIPSYTVQPVQDHSFQHSFPHTERGPPASAEMI